MRKDALGCFISFMDGYTSNLDADMPDGAYFEACKEAVEWWNNDNPQSTIEPQKGIMLWLYQTRDKEK